MLFADKDDGVRGLINKCFSFLQIISFLLFSFVSCTVNVSFCHIYLRVSVKSLDISFINNILPFNTDCCHVIMLYR